MNILADASLPLLIDAFPPPFQLHYYSNAAEIAGLICDMDILLCRSTLKVDKLLLAGHQLKVIATASSGSDHIDTPYFTQNNITILDAKGANAQAVADYVLATLAALKEKELSIGSSAGIIGMGYVGQLIAKRLGKLGYRINCYDPPRAALDPDFFSCSLEALYNCDVLCVHANYTQTQPYPSANLVSTEFLKHMKAGSIIINAARGGIVDEEAIVQHKEIIYCTDVYVNEPEISPAIIEHATLCTPHIAGHSIEAKLNAVVMLSLAIHKYYSLPYHVDSFKTPSPCTINQEMPWDDHVLAHYNPDLETEYLKAASDKTAAFLTLRKAHTMRHDLVCIK